MMVVGSESFLRWVKQYTSRGGRNPTIGIKNSAGHLTGTVVRLDANNNSRDESAVQGSGNNKLTTGRGRERRREFHLLIVNWGVFIGRKK